ncbi:MAG TPA: hypothetical protein VI389_07240 [Geobacteraceae bacterium]
MFAKDLGASIYATWTDEQRSEEIGRLVEGYRQGLPIGILCKMAETVAGSNEKAREILASLMTQLERQAAVDKETGAIKDVAKSFLL